MGVGYIFDAVSHLRIKSFSMPQGDRDFSWIRSPDPTYWGSETPCPSSCGEWLHLRHTCPSACSQIHASSPRHSYIDFISVEKSQTMEDHIPISPRTARISNKIRVGELCLTYLSGSFHFRLSLMTDISLVAFNEFDGKFIQLVKVIRRKSNLGGFPTKPIDIFTKRINVFQRLGFWIGIIISKS